MVCLNSLPPELITEILHQLPIKSLLNYGLTSRMSHAIQQCSLSRLQLGVFHTRLGGMINFIESTTVGSSLHAVRITLPRKGSKNKVCIVYMQNREIRHVVERYQSSLRDLEIAMWELQEGTARSLAQLTNLKHLSIRLDQPRTTQHTVGHAFCKGSPGSIVWNSLTSKKGGQRALGRLQTLRLECAGITDYQLREILKGNPRINVLVLRQCFNLTHETFKFLAANEISRRLKTLHFTVINNEFIDDRVLKYIGEMPMLKSVSLHGCSNIDSQLAEKGNEAWKIADFTPPSFRDQESSTYLEIDPDYR